MQSSAARQSLFCLTVALGACVEFGATTPESTAAPTEPRVGERPVEPGGAPDAGRPARVDPRWVAAVATPGVTIACGDSLDEMRTKGAAHVTVGQTTLVVGARRDRHGSRALFARFDGATLEVCATHAAEDQNTDAHAVSWDGGGHAYVLYVVGQGEGAPGGKTVKTWLPAMPEHALLSGYIASVSVEPGEIARGTYIATPGSLPTLWQPIGPPVVLVSGDIEVRGRSSGAPLNPDLSTMSCVGMRAPFDTRAVFSPDLTTLRCASASACEATTPCD